MFQNKVSVYGVGVFSNKAEPSNHSDASGVIRSGGSGPPRAEYVIGGKFGYDNLKKNAFFLRLVNLFKRLI